MARPIAETPILYGEDAIRFEERMRQVKSLTKKQRAENSRKLKEAVKEAKKYITVCFKKMELVRLTADSSISAFD